MVLLRVFGLKTLSKVKERSDYFLNFDEPFDTSKVVRPRTSDLLNPVKTTNGIKYIWCTFSKDQVDYNFSNPVVLFEFVQIIIFYLAKGITVFRFDAVAFIWKKIGLVVSI